MLLLCWFENLPPNMGRWRSMFTDYCIVMKRLCKTSSLHPTHCNFHLNPRSVGALPFLLLFFYKSKCQKRILSLFKNQATFLIIIMSPELWGNYDIPIVWHITLSTFMEKCWPSGNENAAVRKSVKTFSVAKIVLQ